MNDSNNSNNDDKKDSKGTTTTRTTATTTATVVKVGFLECCTLSNSGWKHCPKALYLCVFVLDAPHNMNHDTLKACIFPIRVGTQGSKTVDFPLVNVHASAQA